MPELLRNRAVEAAVPHACRENAMKLKETLIAGAMLAVVAALAAFWFMPGGVDKAPDVAFKTLDGRTLTMAELRGKPVLVNFWATSCPGCVKEMPDLNSVYQQYKGQGLEIIGVAVSYDPPSHVLEFVRSRNISYPIALDSDDAIARAFGEIRLIPTSFVIARDGRIVQQKIGEYTREQLDAQVRQIIGT